MTTTTATTQQTGLYLHDHWAGAGPARLMAIGPRMAIVRLCRVVDTCSFCGPGQGGYDTGECYGIGVPKYIPRGTPQLPDESANWEDTDLSAWLRDQDCDD